jgi:hypothetical protein
MCLLLVRVVVVLMGTIPTELAAAAVQANTQNKQSI